MPHVPPEHFAAYVIFTLGFLFFCWFFDKGSRPLGARLVLWGVLTVILSCGYGLIGAAALMIVTPALTKIGFLLVLGGVVASVLGACPNATAAKEANHGS